jgi:hypothetical protein
MQRLRAQGSGPSGGPAEHLITAGGYVVLLALGVMEGLVGSFQYSRALGSAPVAAIAFALLIGVTCVLGAWGMHRPMGGLLPAAGWIVASFVLAMGTKSGSVVITNSGAGQWFLYGGSACAVVGALVGFVCWSPRRAGVFSGTDPWQREIPRGAHSAARNGQGGQPQVSDRPQTGEVRSAEAASGEAVSGKAASGEAPDGAGPGAAEPGTEEPGTTGPGTTGPGKARLDARNADARKPDM